MLNPNNSWDRTVSPDINIFLCDWQKKGKNYWPSILLFRVSLPHCSKYSGFGLMVLFSKGQRLEILTEAFCDV